MKHLTPNNAEIGTKIEHQSHPEFGTLTIVDNREIGNIELACRFIVIEGEMGTSPLYESEFCFWNIVEEV